MTPDSIASGEKGERSYWGFVIWPVVVVMVYVLGAGPMFWAYEKCWVGSRALRVYDPLWAAVGKTRLVKPISIYLHFWVPEIFDIHGHPVGHLHD